MANFFIALYHYFERHKTLLYITLLLWTGAMIYCATQIKFEENITSFFPQKGEEDYTNKVFENLKVKDKIIVMFSAEDGWKASADELINCAEDYGASLQENNTDSLIKNILTHIDNTTISSVNHFVRKNLPLFVDEHDYARYDSLTTTEGIAGAMQRGYMQLLSPIGMATKENIISDPIGLSSHAMRHLQELQVNTSYNIIDNHIFSPDSSTLLIFITPQYSTGRTDKNAMLVDIIEQEIENFRASQPNIKIEYFGGPSVSVYNARQIKHDTMVTMSIALLIIVVFILLAFKRKLSILLMLPTVGFGALFALTIIYFTQDSISSISVGIGSIVMGISLSYSIHMLAHQNHIKNIEQLIGELVMPLTIGSFTTIAAFFALLFTSSQILQDFGLFASMTLIGTTLFCLIYLPHFLKGDATKEQNILLRIIERINAYQFERNKVLLVCLVLLTISCAMLSSRVGFDNNMMSLSYIPEHIMASETKLNTLIDNSQQNIMFVSVGKDMEEATTAYKQTNSRLRALCADSLIKEVVTAESFFYTPQEQEERIARWNEYWSQERKDAVWNEVKQQCTRYNFKESAFARFDKWLNGEFVPCNYNEIINAEEGRLFEQWYCSAEGIVMLITQVTLSQENKEAVYAQFADVENVVIFDRSYFTNQWVEAVKDDFNYILMVSSAIIFIALLISYGRIELTLISFLPMCVSWIIIIGIMGLIGIEFNIVNIILSTFIFGIGDDFSIFIMDGLQNKYARGNQLINSHKTAIFCSAFTTVVGMGAMVFAQHPALHSISLLSIIGMAAVVLVAYTVEPVIFNMFIGNPASKGLPPYTLISLTSSILLFLEFFIGCVLISILIAIILPLPIGRKRKQYIVSYCAHKMCKLIIFCFAGKKIYEDITPETFGKPSVIIINHSSFIDILLTFALSPRIVMVTKKWVYNSPVFGIIVRYLGFHYVGDGQEAGIKKLGKKLEEGYSIVVFPEGSRSADGKLQRFHKGAFNLAEELNAEIQPIIFYGLSKALTRRQSFHLNSSTVVVKALQRIMPDDTSYGVGYSERAKKISQYFKREYAALCARYDGPDNPYFYERLVRNFTYKGPVVEWYTRIKVKMEDNYRIFHQLIPRTACITDIGCGYGYLGYMLSMYCPERQVLGIDYDEDKITVAQNGFARGENLHFVCADSLQYDMPMSDVFVLNDMLHYMSYEQQSMLLTRCAEHLNEGGMIIVRDGNASHKKHGVTQLTEVFSTKILRFNKTVEELCFITESQMRDIARQNNLNIETLQNDQYTSNTIYILRR